MNKVNIVEVESNLVMGTKKTGYYKEVGDMIHELFGYAQENDIEFTGPPIFICHETAAAKEAGKKGNAKLEVAFPVKEKVESKYKIYHLPGGKFAEIMQKGPYEQCEATYDSLFKWTKENEFEVKGPIREVYLNNPNKVKEKEILTQVLAPIGK
ncbi:MAG: hypothetical protein MAG795_00090 [Candidatus Woesearchaeota archaeon]|nr:hypothetical protein [Candidatus Woesearchaeota archaeon]